MQLNKCDVCVSLLHRGHSGGECVSASILFRYERRIINLFILCCCLLRPGPSSSQARFPLSR